MTKGLRVKKRVTAEAMTRAKTLSESSVLLPERLTRGYARLPLRHPIKQEEH
jgi:hypothetical protein